MEEMPGLQETGPIPAPVITPIATKEELEEILKEQEIQLAPLHVIASSSIPQTSRPVILATLKLLVRDVNIRVLHFQVRSHQVDFSFHLQGFRGSVGRGLYWPARLRSRGGSDYRQWSELNLLFL